MLIDSNIIIYAAQPDHGALRSFLAQSVIHFSAISYVEVLGYHKITEIEKSYFEQFFTIAPLLPITFPILQKATTLRQTRKITLGDALIAGTAIVHELPLVTHNTADFAWIPDLAIVDPF